MVCGGSLKYERGKGFYPWHYLDFAVLRKVVAEDMLSLISRFFFNVSHFFVRKMCVPCLRFSKKAGEVADMHWVTRGSAVVIFKDAESAKKATETLHKSNLALRHYPGFPWMRTKHPKT